MNTTLKPKEPRKMLSVTKWSHRPGIPNRSNKPKDNTQSKNQPSSSS